jgi:hypothetical protein
VSRGPRIGLPPGPETALRRANNYAPALVAVIRAVHVAIDRLLALDPVTTELVRIRFARHHDCRT